MGLSTCFSPLVSCRQLHGEHRGAGRHLAHHEPHAEAQLDGRRRRGAPPGAAREVGVGAGQGGTGEFRGGSGSEGLKSGAAKRLGACWPMFKEGMAQPSWHL